MNDFGALRLLAALLVLLGHSFVLSGESAPRWFGLEVHNFAVHVFFVISGYLMAGSWAADPSLPRYALRRALRILPALAAVVLGSVLVIGPLSTSLSLRAYVTDPETRTYLWNLALAPYFALPGVFQDGRPFTAVNGSLWTLPVEAAMYVVAPVLAARTRLVRWGVLPVLVLAAVAAEIIFAVLQTGQVTPIVHWTSIPFGLRFAGDFALAAAIRVWRLERGLDLRVALAVLAVLGLLPEGAVRGTVLLVVLPYIVLSVALAPAPLLPRVGRRVDLSYGLYLWGGPMQQVVVSLLGPAIGPIPLLTCSLALALPLAWASWSWVERPFLALKPRRRADRAMPASGHAARMEEPSGG